MLLRIITLFGVLIFNALASAQTTQPTLEPGERYPLGATYESEAAGIAFQGPGDCREIKRTASEQIVQYVNEEKKWSLTVSRQVLDQPVRLASTPDERGKMVKGMLDSTIEAMQADAPGSEVLRHDFINVGDVEVGLIAVRNTLGMETQLSQRALVRASNRLYFNFTLITPAPKTGDLGEDKETARVVDLFSRIIDSVRLIDQSRIVEEQNQRLYRTRAALLNFTEPLLRESLGGEQWWRLVRDGKDIGYSYVVEEIADDLPRRGVIEPAKTSGRGFRIGIRSRTYPEKGRQVDAESWSYLSFDRRNEVWSNVGLITNPDGTKDDFGEFGTADRETRRVLDKNLEVGERLPNGQVDAGQPPVRMSEVYTMTVTQSTRKLRGQPIERALPPFYLPQALNHLLPRLLMKEPKTFLFASWVPERSQVLKRYVDVGAEQYVTLDGKRVRAVPVTDRIGLEGSTTIHYVSPEGAFLASVNKDSKITILPTDRKTLETIWKDADLRRPAAVEAK